MCIWRSISIVCTARAEHFAFCEKLRVYFEANNDLKVGGNSSIYSHFFLPVLFVSMYIDIESNFL